MRIYIEYICQGRNEVYSWDRGSKGWDQGSEGWDLESQPGIRDQRPWDLDQQFFKGSGIKLYNICSFPKLVTLLESRIRNLPTKIGSAL